MTEAEFEDQVKAWIQSAEIDRSTAYLHRGRAYAALADGDLLERWKSAFRGLVADPGSERALVTASDLKSEINLRGQEAPFGEVAEALEDLNARFISEIERLQIEDPVQLAEYDRAITRAIDTFLKQKVKEEN